MPISPFHSAKLFKKALQLIQSYEDKHHFWAQNGPLTPNKFCFLENYYDHFHLPISLFHCANSKKKLFQQIQSYEDLRGRELFLSLTWELDFSQTCSFRRMLMNHNNFHFTQIPDKTNDVIFLNSPKIMFCGHFWPFLPDGDFFQKTSSFTHNYIWPLTLR